MYSGKRIIKAGKLLENKDLKNSCPQQYEESMDCLAYWRVQHVLPLEDAYAEVQEVAKQVEKKPVFSKRLKRAESISSKLRIQQNMRLNRMQDIGGCRVVVSTNKKVLKLAKLLRQKEYISIRNDYVKTPKLNGYRSVHLIGKYLGDGDHKFPIEIQIRSFLQHVWATGVEMIDICTNQSIKSGLGLEDWNEFFKKLADIFIELENIHFLHSLKPDLHFLTINEKMKSDYFSGLIRELVKLQRSLSLERKLISYTKLIKIVDAVIEDKPDNKGYYLVDLDLNKGTLDANNFFALDDIATASDKYVELEKMIEGEDQRIVALVSTEAVGGIKEAYPNYFADAEWLLHYMKIFGALYTKHETILAKLA